MRSCCDDNDTAQSTTGRKPLNNKQVEKDLADLLFAAPDPNNQSNLSYLSAADQAKVGNAAAKKTIHVFPPSETLQQRASVEAREQLSKIKKISTGKVFRQQPETSASLRTEANNMNNNNASKLFESEKSFLLGGSHQKTENYEPALSPNASLQLVVDSANDGDCVYIQPGTHELKEPLFISSKKKIYIIGFVESHTESAPPTLRMKVTAPRSDAEQDKKEGKSHLFSQLQKKYAPVRPMIRVQQGAEVFLSHMRFEYVVEFPDDDLMNDDEIDEENNNKRSQQNKDSSSTPSTRKFTDYVGYSPTRVRSAEDIEEENIMLPEQRRKDQERRKKELELKKKNNKSSEQLEQEKEEKRLKKLRETAGTSTLPLAANILEITGAGTQVTLNHCAFLSDAHGINFRCTATNVSASSTFTASPRLSVRDQCYFECPFGTAVIAISEEDTGFASHAAARLDPMSPPKDSLKHPEGILNISRSAFSLSQCACEFTGPLHIKIADCDFDGCDIGINVTTCMQMQLSISETLFSKCEIAGVLLDAPQGSGSTRDIEISDSRFDFCARGLILQGQDCAALVDTCVVTRSKKCGILMDGGRSTVSNSILQENDVAVEVIDGKSVFANNTFHGNHAAGVLVSGSGTTPTLRENTFTNTGENGPQPGGMRLNALSKFQQEEDESNTNGNDNKSSLSSSTNMMMGRSQRVEEANRYPTDQNTNNNNNNLSQDSYAMALKANEIGFEKGTTLRSSSSSLNAHRRAIRCAAVVVEQDATPLVEYNRFEGNYGANVLIISGFGVFTDNAFGGPATDSYNIVVSNLKACPRFEHNVICGNERGQARPTVVVEDGAAAILQLNDFTHGSSSAIVLRRSGPQTVVSQNRISKFLEGIVVMERSQGIASRNSMGRLNVEVFSDSKDSFDVL